MHMPVDALNYIVRSFALFKKTLTTLYTTILIFTTPPNIALSLQGIVNKYHKTIIANDTGRV
jgi:hypothetical protein